MNDEQTSAASYFLARAKEAIEAADTARSMDAGAAFYKEAETWLFMAAKCLGRGVDRPSPLTQPFSRAPREPRSFSEG